MHCAYGVLHWLCWLWLCGAGTRAVCTVNSNFHSAHSCGGCDGFGFVELGRELCAL